jgi:hypothetical protein
VLIEGAAHLLARLIQILAEFLIGLFGFNFGFIQSDAGIMLHLFGGLVSLRTGSVGVAL